jgi:hypothetical protein
MGRKTKKKLDYFKKFLYTDKINILSVTGPTVEDNNLNFYKQILRNENEKHQSDKILRIS